MTVFLAAGVLLCFGAALWWWRIRRRPAELKTVVENNHAKKVFVLVHGTFASAARWTTQESDFVKAISAYDSNTAVYTFVWWGRNSVRQRLYYAEQLGKRISEVQARHPDAGVTIVAHSHGGAVSLKALEFAIPAGVMSALFAYPRHFFTSRKEPRGYSKEPVSSSGEHFWLVESSPAPR